MDRFISWSKEHYILLGILVIGAFLRFYHIDFQSVWLDEIHTMLESDPSVPLSEALDTMTLREQQPQLYFLIVRLVSVIFGHSFATVRCVSAIFGILGIFSIYLLGKELHSRKAGYVAAAFLSVNYFHIWYSQESRPYAMFFLGTVLAFYGLVKYIKLPNYKNAIWFGVYAAFMIYGHFFGLFVLFSQYLLLLYFLLETPKQERKQFFLTSLVSGLVTLVLWSPTIKVFVVVSKMKAFWIKPSVEPYTGLFREFFGVSEMPAFIVTVLVMYYAVVTFNHKNNAESERTVHNKHVFGFVVVGTWILIGLLLPLIRSYLDVPMIISRYFISMLPAILLILAISVAHIVNRKVAAFVVFAFVLVSLTDVAIVKNHYNKVNKTQFREISAKLIEKNQSHARIVSIWAWHFGYFFNHGAQKNEMVEKNLEDYVRDLMAHPDQEKQAFWYIDANERPYQLSADAETFLNDNFYATESLEYFDTWAKFYVPKASAEKSIELDINTFSPIKSENKENILLFSNSTTHSAPIELEPGNYRVAIKTRSLPNPPINGENAHLDLAISGKTFASYYISEMDKVDYFQFKMDSRKQVTFDITFGNDAVLDNMDRNALIFSVVIEKVKN